MSPKALAGSAVAPATLAKTKAKTSGRRKEGALRDRARENAAAKQKRVAARAEATAEGRTSVAVHSDNVSLTARLAKTQADLDILVLQAALAKAQADLALAQTALEKAESALDHERGLRHMAEAARDRLDPRRRYIIFDLMG